MKTKKYIYIIFICLIITFVGCSSLQTLNQNKMVKVGNNSEIIIKTGSIPNNLAIIGVKDEKNFYCLNGPNFKNIYLYNTETGTSTLFKSPVSSQNFIRTACINDKWLVWIEDEGKIESDPNSDINWTVYAQNLKTRKIIEIDKYKKIKLEPAIYMALEPKELSLSGDKVVYDNYDILNDGKIAAVIKMYDLSNENMQFIEYNKAYKDGFFSHPKISNNFIVWSLSKCNLNDYSELGDTYLYNIDNKEKKLISQGKEILWPYIYGNLIAARVKPNGQNENSSIVLYDLYGKAKWTTVASPQSNPYKNEKHVELMMPIISGTYLIWQDNYRSKILVYNCGDKKIYKIDEKYGSNGLVMPIGIYNKTLFWQECRENDNRQKSKILVTKYAIFK